MEPHQIPTYDVFAGALAVSGVGKGGYDRAHRTTTAVVLPPVGQRCIFCPGNESDTDTELARIPVAAHGWSTRALANKYPFDCGVHEVLVCAADHDWSVHTASPASLTDALTLWSERVGVLSASSAWVSSWLSYGAEAGQSQPHPHIQLLGFPVVPPGADAEAKVLTNGTCILCAPGPERVGVMAGAQVVLSDPGEQITISPTDRTHQVWSAQSQAQSLAWAARAMWAVHGPVAYNVIFHSGPDYRSHPHIHLVPRPVAFTAVGYVEGWRATCGQWSDRAAAWSQALAGVAAAMAPVVVQ